MRKPHGKTLECLPPRLATFFHPRRKKTIQRFWRHFGDLLNERGRRDMCPLGLLPRVSLSTAFAAEESRPREPGDGST